MKKILFLLLITLMISSTQSKGQNILMKIPSVTAAAGEEVRTLEFQINAASSWTKGGGASVGKPNPASLIIKKANNKSTSEFLKSIGQGKSFPEIIFEYYDAANKLYYSITLTNVFLTQLNWLTLNAQLV